MKPPSPFSTLVAFTVGTLLTACGGSNTTPTPVSGVFVDSAVEGLDYSIANASKGSTSASGGFTCNIGDRLSFSLGGLALGSALCDGTITPLSLANSTNVKDDAVVNRLMVLQLLDEDNDPANGVKLSAEVKTQLTGKTLDFSAPASTINSAMSAIMAGMPSAYRSRSVNAERRQLVSEHFENTLATQLGAPAIDSITQTNALGSVSASVTRYQIQAADKFHVPYEGTSAAIKSAFPKGFLPSYGSGLSFKGKTSDGTLEFYGITDRGPNGDGPKVANSVVTPGATGSSDAKFFPAPGFVPAIGIIAISKDGAVLKSSMPIKFNATTNASGLSIAAGKVGSSGEVPLGDDAKYDATSKTTFSDFGIDTESVVLDSARGVLWVSDEYGPFILKIDLATGVILKKYQPGTGATDLPAVLVKRRANRGMEGLALEPLSAKLHGFIQSPLDDGKASYVLPGATAASSESIKDYAKFVRWVEFDPATETSKLYAYPIDGSQYAAGRTGNAKLGDLVALGGGKFIVIEQGAGPDGKVFNRLMLVQIPATATNIASLGTDLEKSSMAGIAVNAANYANIVTLKKTLLFDLNGAGWLAEKAEGLALVDDNTLVLTNDGDFGLKTLVLTADGTEIADADITKCTVDAKGAITTTASAAASGCTAGNTTRLGRGKDSERPNRLWLFKFGKKLADFSVPGA